VLRAPFAKEMPLHHVLCVTDAAMFRGTRGSCYLEAASRYSQRMSAAAF
jgi:hypothetical protein